MPQKIAHKRVRAVTAAGRSDQHTTYKSKADGCPAFGADRLAEDKAGPDRDKESLAAGEHRRRCHGGVFDRFKIA